LRAAQDGLSVETEVRNILTTVCLNDRKPVSSLQHLVDRLYQGKKTANVVEQLIQELISEAKNE
jgi:plasmid stability protein